MKIFKALRTSEFWVGTGTAVGGFLAWTGVIPKDAWDHIVYPAITYVVGRVVSKVVKAV